MSKKTFKCIMLGDAEVGKTSLLIRYADKSFSSEHDPALFESRSVDVPIEEGHIKLHLCDGAAEPDFDELKKIASDKKVVLVVALCFSVDNRSSYDSIKNKWIPELAKFARKVPMILVCTKADLRNDQTATKRLESQKSTGVTSDEGEQLKESIGAKIYLETSSKNDENVDNIFEDAVELGLKVTKSKCLCIVI